MKKRFTILAVAFALLAFLAIPMGMRGQASVGTTMWAEDFSSYVADDVPSGDITSQTGTTIYNNGTVNYSVTNGGGTTKIYNANLAEGEVPELLVAKGGGSWTIAGIPTGNAVELTLTYKTNNTNNSISSTTEGVTVVEESSKASTKSFTIGTGGASFITLVVTNMASGNTRVDDFSLVVKTPEGGTPTPTTYAVTYDCNGGTSGCPENVTGIEAGTQIQLAAAPTKTDYTFDGWSDGSTTYQAEANYTVNGNVTMTAQWTEIVSGDEQWVLTNLADLTEDDVFVIVGNNDSNYAMSNNNGTGSAPSAVAVTVTDNEITSAVPSTIMWTISGNASDGYTFYPNGSTTTWLYCYNNNNGLRVGTSADKTFVVNSNYLYNVGQNRYIGIYNSQDWRCYTSINNNIQNQTFAFYKKVTGGVIPPSIIAANVDIAYNVTSGSIAYTINNGVTGGTMSVATESDWLTLGQGTTSPISFTCAANEGAAERTAIVTLTYTYNRATATANVTVTQAGNPNVIDNISDITATGVDYAVIGTVVAASARGFVMGDGTGYVYTYLNAIPEVAVGDIKKISGTMGSYNHVLQFTNTATIEDATNSNYNNTPAIQVLDATGIGTYSEGLHLSDYVQIEGMLSISGNYYNIAVDGLTSTASISYPTDAQKEEMTDLDNKHVIVKGYFAGVSSGHFNVLLGTIEEVVSAEPSITIVNPTVDVPVEGAEGTLTVYYENIEEMVANVYFCDAEGDAASYDWIYAEVDDDNNLYYSINPNDGEARTAYLKVYEGNTNTYSNLVTINQAAYVAPTYAELPFEFNEGRAAIEETDGLYQEGLGTDYSATNAPNTKLKFDGTGDWLLLQFNERPGTLTFNIRNNSFSGGTFKVQTSEDGVTYTDLFTYTEITETQDEEFSNLGENVRYIKWIYTEKVSGNVGLGNIVLQPYVAPQEYTLTVGSLSNVELFVFDASNESQAIIEGEGSAQVLNGTTIEISVSAMDGYVLQSLMVDGLDVTSQIDGTGAYTFTMPTHDVTITATAIEYVAGGDYVRISSLDQLTDGSKVIIAARYDADHTNGYYAMPGETSGKPTGVAFTSETSGTDEILPAVITASEETYYWTVNVTEDGYTFTNANGQMIGYTSGTNFATGGDNTEWTIELSTSESGLVPNYSGFVISNKNNTSRAFAFNGTVFGAYSLSNINAGYNFFLDFFVQTAASETVTQTITLAQGINWVSFYVETDMDALKEALVEALPGATSIIIKSQKNGQTAYNGTRWRGALSTLDLALMYQITVTEGCEFTLEAMPLDPAQHSITIKNGPNWIGFPFNEAMTPTDAFAGLPPVSGDVLKSKTQQTNYSTRWRGALNTLVPGQGYIYNSAETVDKVFVYPTNTNKTVLKIVK